MTGRSAAICGGQSNTTPMGELETLFAPDRVAVAAVMVGLYRADRLPSGGIPGETPAAGD